MSQCFYSKQKTTIVVDIVARRLSSSMWFFNLDGQCEGPTPTLWYHPKCRTFGCYAVKCIFYPGLVQADLAVGGKHRHEVEALINEATLLGNWAILKFSSLHTRAVLCRTDPVPADYQVDIWPLGFLHIPEFGVIGQFGFTLHIKRLPSRPPPPPGFGFDRSVM
jgi:hypothetical protein